jgi:hypothetical protein
VKASAQAAEPLARLRVQAMLTAVLRANFSTFSGFGNQGLSFTFSRGKTDKLRIEMSQPIDKSAANDLRGLLEALPQLVADVGSLITPPGEKRSRRVTLAVFENPGRGFIDSTWLTVSETPRIEGAERQGKGGSLNDTVRGLPR